VNKSSILTFSLKIGASLPISDGPGLAKREGVPRACREIDVIHKVMGPAGSPSPRDAQYMS